MRCAPLLHRSVSKKGKLYLSKGKLYLSKVQGETVSTKLLIDIIGTVQLCSLYTGMSRALHINQIYIVNTKYTPVIDGKIYGIDYQGLNFVGSTVLSLEEESNLTKQVNAHSSMNKEDA